MILVVDAGNTRIKWAQLTSGNLIDHRDASWGSDEAEIVGRQWGRLEAPKRVLVSNVAGRSKAALLGELCQALWQVAPEFVSVAQSACGLVNEYRDPQQLGVDRWMAAIAAWSITHRATCVVDCGTALTVDAIDGDGHYLGGLIAPGVSLMASALATNTAALPEVNNVKAEIFAKTTQDAIAGGCTHAAAGVVDRVRGALRQRCSTDVDCIVTGGEAELLVPHLDKPLRYVPDLVLRGLAAIAGDRT